MNSFLLAALAQAALAQGAPAADLAAAERCAAEHCGACHRATGQRAAPSFPRQAGQPPAYIAAQLRSFHQQTRTSDRVAMKFVTSRMSDLEVNVVAACLGPEVRAAEGSTRGRRIPGFSC